jgi:hypothetical protein
MSFLVHESPGATRTAESLVYVSKAQSEIKSMREKSI